MAFKPTCNLTWNVCIVRGTIREPRRADDDDHRLGAAGREPQAKERVAGVVGYKICGGTGGRNLHDQRLNAGQVEDRSFRLRAPENGFYFKVSTRGRALDAKQTVGTQRMSA